MEEVFPIQYQKTRESEVKKVPLSEFTPSEAGVTMAEFILSPSVSEDVKAEFADWIMLINNMSCLSYIERHERLELIMGFRCVSILLNWGDVRTAREYMAEMLFELMISRSVDAVGIIYGLQGITSKSVDYNMPGLGKKEEGRKGLIGKIAGALKGGNK